MHASILSHSSLEKSLAFHMANLISSPSMISTQIQALFLEALESSPSFRLSLRLDILAVMIRDPAVQSFTDVLLYFKGFQALQTHRVAHWLWNNGRKTLGNDIIELFICFVFLFFYYYYDTASFLHSRANTVFHIDIHPAATLGQGLLIDHGTGVVIGETAVIGDNVSMLHRVTLGGTGVKGVTRHPQIGNCVLLGAGATLLGAIRIGDGANIGACSMVVEDIPPYAVAVGVPAKILKQKNNSSSDNQIDILKNIKVAKAASTELNLQAPSYTMDSTTLFYEI
jgi:serine O-acetyltransferase